MSSFQFLQIIASFLFIINIHLIDSLRCYEGKMMGAGFPSKIVECHRRVNFCGRVFETGKLFGQNQFGCINKYGSRGGQGCSQFTFKGRIGTMCNCNTDLCNEFPYEEIKWEQINKEEALKKEKEKTN